MERDVFADTSGLYALVDRNDAAHETARQTITKILSAGRRLVTTDYIVTESINLANARGGSVVATRLLDLVEQSRGLRMEWMTLERFDSAKTFFRKHADQHFSFTDCTSFVLMRELRLTSALTSDRHFAVAGFRSLLAPSPRK